MHRFKSSVSSAQALTIQPNLTKLKPVRNQGNIDTTITRAAPDGEESFRNSFFSHNLMPTGRKPNTITKRIQTTLDAFKSSACSS